MELGRDLLRGSTTRIAKSALLAALMVASYTVGIFLVSLENAMSQGFSPDAQREFISLTDTLTNPDDFAEVAGSEPGVRAAGRFYQELTKLPHGDFLSAHNQPVEVAGFTGGRELFLTRGDGQVVPAYENPLTKTLVQPVTSMQLNQAAWTFYGLTVREGSEFAWADVDYSADAVPVILGDAYRGGYRLGDTMKVDFYGRVLTIKVIGFLQPKSHMFFKGEINYPLDTSLILAYPPKLPEQIADADAKFYSIMAFTMIAGDVAVAHDSSVAQVRRDVELASQRSQFPWYTLLGVSNYLTQYTLVRDLIVYNRDLIIGLLLMVTLVTVFFAGWVNRRTVRERHAWITASWILGQPRAELRKVVLGSGLAYAGVTVAMLIVGMSRLPGHDPTTLLGLTVAVGVALLVDLSDELRLANSVMDPARQGTA